MKRQIPVCIHVALKNLEKKDHCFLRPLFTAFEYIWLFLLCAWFGGGLGLLLGQLFPTALATVLAMIMPLVLGAMFGGANPTLTELKGSWEILVTHISYARYAIESATNYENNHLPEHLRTNIGDNYIEVIFFLLQSFNYATFL